MKRIKTFCTAFVLMLCAVCLVGCGAPPPEPAEYEVTFTSQNTSFGTVSASRAGMPLTSGQKVEENSSVTFTATAFSGYSFDGWYQGQTRVSSASPYTVAITSDLSLQAKFSAYTYAFEFMSADETMGTVASSEVLDPAIAHGTSIHLTATAKPGFDFAGWYNKISGDKVCDTAVYEFNMPQAALSLEARFVSLSYPLNFAAENPLFGTVAITPASIQSGDDVACGMQLVLTATALTGYDFEGWYNGTDRVSADATYSFQMPGNALSLTACFVAEKRTVTFFDGLDIISSSEVDYNSTATEFEPTKQNHTFLGWYVSPEAGAALYDFDTPVTDNLSLYAQFKEDVVMFDVAFVDDDGAPLALQQVLKGNAIAQKPGVNPKTGYVFDKWLIWDETQQDYVELPANFEVHSDVTIKASYVLQTFTVKFYEDEDASEPLAALTQTVEYNALAVKPQTPQMADYIFASWVDEAGVAFSFQTPITESISLFGTWTPLPATTYTVKFFDAEGGTLLDTQIVEENSVASLPAQPSKTGFTFDKWLYKPSLETPAVAFSAETLVTQNCDVWATFKVQQLTVTFYDHDGQVLKDEQLVNYGEGAIAPQDPQRTGFDFAGWDKAFTNVTENMEITATYTVQTFVVSFMDGEDTLTTQTVSYGEFALVPTTPQKAGHSFVGWFTSSSLETAFDFATTSITKTTSVFAKFEKIVLETFTVKFIQPDGQTVISEQTVVKGASAIAPGTPSQEGHTFTGWDKSFTNVESNLVVTAQYQIIKYSVTFIGASGAQIGEVVQVNHGQTASSVQPSDALITPPQNQVFVGWDKNIDALLITKDTTFTAVFALETFKVTFLLATGAQDPYKEISVQHSGLASMPTTPQKAGYYFEYWHLDGTDTAFDFSSPITADTTLVAKFTHLADVFVVTFIGADNQQFGNVQIVAENGFALEPAPFTDQTGNTYTWCLEDGTAFDFDNTPITGDITLYAKVITG